MSREMTPRMCRSLRPWAPSGALIFLCLLRSSLWGDDWDV